ncbi:MAG: urease accessory protein UreD [Roseobacter sp.]|jgi:urease accessory protein|nr:urease accessory protein UreD [Roseobacter sp.]
MRHLRSGKLHLTCVKIAVNCNDRNRPAVLMRAATPLDQPRAIGRASVSSKTGADGNAIDTLRQSGALKLLFPRSTGPLEVVSINTSGGVTGGDDFTLHCTAGKGSCLSITTQAAERAYRAQSGQTGHVDTVLRVEDGGTLWWLPQETILYDGCAFHRRLSVHLAPKARFLMVEPILFGRRAMGEDACSLQFRDRVDIRRGGLPLYRDGITLGGAVGTQLDRPAAGAGARAMASLVYVNGKAESRLEQVRTHLGPAGGASLLQPDVMVLRLLAEDGFDLRRALMPVLDLLTENTLPKSWRL